MFEYNDAMRLAEQIGARVRVIEVDVLADERVRQNPSNRCYYCKQAIFGNILRAAAEDGYTLILDGTNASDDEGDRPGMKALKELQVRSPLRECGLTKDMIRQLSRQAGLFTWDKPAYACLATRIRTMSPMMISAFLPLERGCFSALFSLSSISHPAFVEGLSVTQSRPRLYPNSK